MLTGAYLLLIKFPGTVALHTLPVKNLFVFCGLLTDTVNSSHYVCIISNELEKMWKEKFMI
jgi:hypothetical protein